LRAASLQAELPPPETDAVVRILASNDLLGTVIPMPTTYGTGGSIPGIVELFDRQLESIPSVWVDSGGLTLGGAGGSFGHRALLELPRLPLSVAAVGDDDLDGGPDGLRRFAAQLSFLILCADRDVGVPATALIDTPHGPIGFIGVSHPFTHLLAQAPPPNTGPSLLGELAEQLRRTGARWVLALLHNGVSWWGSTIGNWADVRSDSLELSVSHWASQVDAILGGHTRTAWTGHLHGTPAGHAHAYAASVLPVDLCANPPHVRIHQPTRVPPRPRAVATETTMLLRTAGDQAVGELANTWDSHPAAEHYLPNLVATAMRANTGAEAAFVPASRLFTQAPVDGTVAALRAGEVSALDTALVGLLLDRDPALLGPPVSMRAATQNLIARGLTLNRCRGSNAGAWW
jgi:2',3'-cyclic-nucleotide 2'-phosphodiesterase (5'-nucleotidase family)